MPVVNNKSVEITALDAKAILEKEDAAGRPIVSSGKATVLSSDSDSSVYRLGRVHTSSTLVDVGYAVSNNTKNGGVTGATDCDFGFYYTAADGGAVIDKDCLADGVSIADLIPMASILNAKDVGVPVWEIAGLASDPKKYIDYCMTGNTIGNADGVVAGYITTKLA